MSFDQAGQWGPHPVLNAEGKALPAATFEVFEEDGTTPATLYTDESKGTVQSQPVNVDGLGNATFWAVPGRYVIKFTVGGASTSFDVPAWVDPTDVISRPEANAAFARVVPLSKTCTGDGSDETASVQAAFDAAGAAPGKAKILVDLPVTVHDNLYLHGLVDLESVGDGEIILDAEPENSAYWIICGTTGYGATDANGMIVPWSGTISARFRLTADGWALRMINPMVCEDWYIEKSIFDVREVGQTTVGINAPGGIGGYNNANFANPPFRRRGHIRKNIFLAEQGEHGSEPIGIGSAEGLWVEDNWCYGWGDDLGIHWCSDVSLKGNKVWSTDGRLLVNSTTNFTIEDNYIERIALPDGTWLSGGSLIFVSIESSAGAAPSDFIVARNLCQHGSGITSSTYGIRIRGARRWKCVDNVVRDDTGFGRGITYSGQDAGAWTDPEGVDNDGKARIRDFTISGNDVSDTAEATHGIREEVPFADHVEADTGAVFGNHVLPENHAIFTNLRRFVEVRGTRAVAESLQYVDLQGLPVLGSPVLELRNRHVVLSMETGGDRIWSFPSVRLPGDWKTYRAILGWANADASAGGDVAFGLRRSGQIPGDAIASPPAVTTTVGTCGDEDEVEETQIITAGTASLDPITFNLHRSSSGPNANVLYLRLEKAS